MGHINLQQAVGMRSMVHLAHECIWPLRFKDHSVESEPAGGVIGDSVVGLVPASLSCG